MSLDLLLPNALYEVAFTLTIHLPMHVSKTMSICLSVAALVFAMFTTLVAPVQAQAEDSPSLPVTTEFVDAATGQQVLDSREDRLPAFYGNAGDAPSALVPAGTAWKARWQTMLKVPAKDDYHFELRGSGSASMQVSGEDIEVTLDEQNKID